MNSSDVPARLADHGSRNWGRAQIGAAVAALAGGGALMAFALMPAASNAAPAQAVAASKVTLCHRTDSETNPYVQITIAVAAAHNAHLKNHEGDVWYPGHPKEPKWGDIIPPFTYKGVVYSLNWNAAGQAIWENGCKPAVQATSSSASSSSSSSSVAASSTSVAPSSSGVLATSVSNSSSAGVAGVSTSAAPIPAGVNAGLVAVNHPSSKSALPVVGGAALIALGGVGMATGRRTYRRAH